MHLWPTSLCKILYYKLFRCVYTPTSLVHVYLPFSRTGDWCKLLAGRFHRLPLLNQAILDFYISVCSVCQSCVSTIKHTWPPSMNWLRTLGVIKHARFMALWALTKRGHKTGQPYNPVRSLKCSNHTWMCQVFDRNSWSCDFMWLSMSLLTHLYTHNKLLLSYTFTCTKNKYFLGHLYGKASQAFY